MKKILILCVAALTSATAISARGECKADRETFCASVPKGDKKAMWQCMKDNEAQLSEPCKNHIAQMREKNKSLKKACKEDYKKLCKDVKPGEGRIIKCLKENEAQLSEGCKTALAEPAKVE
jgi:hypothetical protein